MSDEPKTHWDGCWNLSWHHDCAIKHINYLRDLLAETQEELRQAYADAATLQAENACPKCGAALLRTDRRVYYECGTTYLLSKLFGPQLVYISRACVERRLATSQRRLHEAYGVIKLLRAAFHAAIRKPKGIVPDKFADLYDPDFAGEEMP